MTSSFKGCIFCSVVDGVTPAQIVFEDELSIAFLDHRPLFPGHVLLIPKKHFETLSDLPSELVGPLFQNGQLLSRAVEKALDAEGSFVAMNNRVSQSVPHLHLHVVPRKRKDGLKGFFWPRNKYQNDEHAKEVQKQIKSVIAELKEKS
jgi:histidine triad (HIT) family protein